MKMSLKRGQCPLILLLLLVLSCGGEDPVSPAPEPQGPDSGLPGPGGNTDPPKNPWDANRGKIVTPPAGSGWISTTIQEGLVYYSFSGLDAISNAKQRVFVADVDLNSKKYAVKLEYHSPGMKTSEVFKEYNALVSMNAGYERESIFIKVDGQRYSVMPNDVVGTTTVPNWKSEAAIYLDGDMDVRIAFVARTQFPNLYKSDQDLDRVDINYELRKFYTFSKERNILSSAPMLLDDFEPVGENFVNPKLTTEQISALDYENPDRHQGVRHPRTVFAKTENNHALFIVIDGRRSNLSEGMTAKEATRFLVKYFNPQYAINLDGGGSSALCVMGKGDSQTHVVNYPSDNGDSASHSGERAVNSHLYVIER